MLEFGGNKPTGDSAFTQNISSVSKIPSLSSSKSVASGIPSPSVSVSGVRLQASSTPASKWSAVPELSVSAGAVYPSPPVTFPSASIPVPSTIPFSSASVKPASSAS